MTVERKEKLVRRIISGGQTGVDRAALDAAIALGLEHGGWCPAGRLAEDGTIPQHYRLKETPSAEYAVRTEWNVRDADATLIICRGPMSGGTELTFRLARRLRKPCYVIDLAKDVNFDAVRAWLRENKIAVLNVAGPRESQAPGIYSSALNVLLKLLGYS